MPDLPGLQARQDKLKGSLPVGDIRGGMCIGTKNYPYPQCKAVPVPFELEQIPCNAHRRKNLYMPGSSHPLETLNGVRGVQEVRNTPAWLAEERSSRNEVMSHNTIVVSGRICNTVGPRRRTRNTIIVPGGGLVEESTGERGFGRVCCK